MMPQATHRSLCLLTGAGLALAAAALGAEVLLARSSWYNGGAHYARGRVGPDQQVHILAGTRAGERLPVQALRLPGGEPPRQGQTLLLSLSEDGTAGIAGQARERPLLWLLAAFVWTVLAAGGRQAWRALLTMALALVGPLAVAPLLLRGGPPILVTGLLGLALLAGMITVNLPRRAARPAAFAGAAAGLLLTVLLAMTVVHALRLSGVHDWPTRGLWQQPAGRGLDFPGLLVAGLIICALGVVMDLATAISVSIHEVAQLNPHLSRTELRQAGLRVGRDVIGTELNSLIFAFAGANVGLMLLPILGASVQGFEVPALHAVSAPVAAIGIAETLLATLGLVITIPLTAWIAAALADPDREAHHDTRPDADVVVPATPATGEWPRRRMAGALAMVLVLWAAAAFPLARYSHTYGTRPGLPPTAQRHMVQARVTAADRLPHEILGDSGGLRAEAEQTLQCRLLSGPLRGRTLTVINPFSGQPGNDKPAHPGDRVLLELRLAPGTAPPYATLLEIERGQPLLGLLVLLLAAVLLTGHQRGLRAITALGASALVIWICIRITAAWHWPAVPVFAAGALPLSALVFLILAGPTRKALVAALGSLAAVFTGGLAALLCAWLMRFSGLHAGNLMAIRLFAGADGLDFRGLYVAGVLLGAIGVAMDVAIAIASAASEIRAAAPTASRQIVYARALLIGRSVMAPMTLTLLCAYLGMNLPLLILPWAGTGLPPAMFINRDPVAAEIVRILAGSLAVAAAVPLTALFAAWLLPPAETPRNPPSPLA